MYKRKRNLSGQQLEHIDFLAQENEKVEICIFQKSGEFVKNLMRKKLL